MMRVRQREIIRHFKLDLGASAGMTTVETGSVYPGELWLQGYSRAS